MALSPVRCVHVIASGDVKKAVPDVDRMNKLSVLDQNRATAVFPLLLYCLRVQVNPSEDVYTDCVALSVVLVEVGATTINELEHATAPIEPSAAIWTRDHFFPSVDSMIVPVAVVITNIVRPEQ